MQLSERTRRTMGLNAGGSVKTLLTADLKHYSANFAEWGSGPPILMCPGLAGGIDLLEPIARRLARTHHVIVLESRGERDAFALRRRFSIDDLADDVVEFANWRGLERPALVGISFGAVVGLIAAARSPGLFSAVAVQGAGARFEFGLIQRVAHLVLDSYPLPDDCPFLNQFFGVLFGAKVDRQQLSFAARCCWQTDQCVMAHRLKMLRQISLDRALPHVICPTLVISGTRDSIVSAANARSLVDRLPDCHHARIPSAGHLAPVSHPRETAESITRFLAAAEV
jgi:pimeloyl-ACP methyl ester carboxylesterase